MSDPTPVPADPATSADTVAHLERRIVEMETTHRARLVRAELKAEAVRHGMVDLDGLKLLDPTSVEFDEAGEIRGASTVMRDMKRAKPWLFGPPGSGGAFSSSTATPPAAATPTTKTAMKMTHAEWQSARADLLKRR